MDFDIDAATLRALGSRAEGIDVDAFLREFEEIRYQEVLGAYRPYREVLRRSLAQAMQRYGLPYRDDDGAAIVAAVPEFGPFPEVPPALERIRRHCKLAIISNTAYGARTRARPAGPTQTGPGAPYVPAACPSAPVDAAASPCLSDLASLSRPAVAG